MPEKILQDKNQNMVSKVNNEHHKHTVQKIIGLPLEIEIP